MSNDIQQQTTVNIQEKANLIWAIADKLVGMYKPHEYGNVIGAHFTTRDIIYLMAELLVGDNEEQLEQDSKIRRVLRGALTDEIDSREMFMKGIDYSYYYEQEDEQ